MMRKTLVFGCLAALLLCGSQVWADTQVEAVITGQQTWTEAGSPYRISRDTLLASGAVLTLQPGVLVLISNGGDHNIPSLSPRVDWAIQGTLIIEGKAGKPVRISCVDKNSMWGALFAASNQDMTWRYLDLQGGRLVVSNTHLTMEDCRVSSGEGVQVGAQAKVDMIGCQVDANKIGLAFLDPSAQVRLLRTRFWDNEMALYYKTNGVLAAAESSVSESDKWHIVNATASPIRIPVLWWGTADPTEVTGKVYDGSRRKGIGMVSFEGIAGGDPFASNVSGFTPREDPRKRLWQGPKYLVGIQFQWLKPDLNIRLLKRVDGAEVSEKVKFKSTLGYGGTIGWLATPRLEMRALVQATDVSTSDPKANSHLDISFFQVGVAGRFLLPLNERQSFFAFVEGGGLMNFSTESNSAPTDSRFPDQDIVSRTHKETNIGCEAGAGVMTRLGKSYKAELGMRYEMLPMSNSRGGSVLCVQAGLAFYFR
jgi:opacity protein-like surface antigen